MRNKSLHRSARLLLSMTIITLALLSWGVTALMKGGPTPLTTLGIETAPSVSNTNPANNAINRPTNTDISVTFDEPVNVTGNWFQIVCGSSGTRNVADTSVTGGPTTFTINPNSNFANAEICTLTIFAAQVTDQDANDPPDNMASNYVFSFITITNPSFVSEVEPNNTTATAQALTGSSARVRGNIQPGTDIDFYSFTAGAGDRVYAAAQTSLSSGGSGLTGDGTLELFATDGTTILESDNDDGSFAATSPTIAGLVLPTAGTYFIKFRHSSAAPASEIDPYDLYLQVQSGAPATETEPNNNGQTPNPIPASGWISGVIDPAGPPIDNDTYSIVLKAGDTIFISLDANPERDGTTFNPRMGFGLFDNFFLLADGSAAVSPNSEAFFFTVREAGTYVIYVDTAVAGAGPTATYQLSTSVFPAQTARVCTTYTSSNVPQTIPVAAGTATSTLNIPDNIKIGNLKVSLNITHSALGELDISLIAPDGNEVVLVDDPPAAAAGTTAPQIDLTLDDEAGIPMALFGINKSFIMQPESLARLEWFKNQSATGTWTLMIRDDAGVGSGTLNGWGLTVCVDPPVNNCSVAETSVFSSDFEATDGGFTHSGTADEWERGLPTFAPITTCHSGTNCWKTDLDNTYNNAPTGQRVDQELLSPPIDLTSFTTQRLSAEWAMKYNIEGSNWENAYVEIRQVGGPAVKRLWEWAGPTMTRTVGSPAVTINSAAGWGTWRADVSEFAGMNVRLAFHLDQDDSVALAGIAIDDVSIKSCSAPTAADSTVRGTITGTNGAPLAGTVVRMSGTQERKTITDANGDYKFENVETNGFYTLVPSLANYSFSPGERSFSQLSNTTEAVFTGSPSGGGGNAIDTPEYFVRQHYLDFLGREPDEAGFNFWSDQILSCGSDAECFERRQINVSAAYFLSIEFRKTGALVDGLYRVSYARAPHYNEFGPDAAAVGRDVIVGSNTGWEATLARNTEEFLNAWVERPEFKAAYDNLANDRYVDALINNTSVEFTGSEREALVIGLNNLSLTRAQVLQRVAENERFVSAKFNEAFVRMQYFGYLRRDPDNSGFHFWLNKLNEFEGNFERAEMVKAFLVSGEYRDRFRQ